MTHTAPSAADTIAAPGKSITLNTGNAITLRYTFSALAELEREHGSIDGLGKKLDGSGPVFSTIGHALWAGSERKVPLVAFLDLLDPARIQEYGSAFNAALSEALGAQQGEGKAA